MKNKSLLVIMMILSIGFITTCQMINIAPGWFMNHIDEIHEATQLPKVDAGTNQIAYRNALVQLSGSHDIETNKVIGINWAQISGESITFSNINTLNPSFIAPNILGVLQFSLIVDSSNYSGTDQCQVDIINQQPIVDAGTNQTTVKASLVQLSGNISEPDGDSFTFYWEQISGETVTLDQTNILNPTFTSPINFGNISFKLNASDTYTNASDEVSVEIAIAQTKFNAPDGASGDYFGTSVAIASNGQTFILGAPGDDDLYSSAGSAYIYQWKTNQWVSTKLNPSMGTNYAHYGESVGISADGNTIVVGSPSYDSDKGEVYTYRWNGTDWQESRIVADFPVDGHQFGRSVSVSGDGLKIAIGVPGYNTNQGTVYICEWNGSSWDRTNITASGGLANEKFGESVSFSDNGEVCLVGAPYEDTSMGAAYAYIWNGSGWDETKFMASDRDTSDLFGTVVETSASGYTNIIGAPGVNNERGAAYAYFWDGSSWNETKFVAYDTEIEDLYGSSVSISDNGTDVVIGSYQDDDEGNNSGSIYYYQWDGSSWNETKILANDAATSDYFGCCVSFSGNAKKAIIGAKYSDDMGLSSGAVYLLEGF